jgi:hypothetical protein
MTPILFAFLAIMAPAAVVLGGLAIIKRTARWRESRTKRAQDMEFAAHEAKLARMNQIADKAAGMKRSAQRQSNLHVVPQSATPQGITPTRSTEPVEPFILFHSNFTNTYPEPAAAPSAPAAYAGNGDTFDGGGASADWSCSPSSDSGSSDSGSSGGSCGTGD